MSEVLKRLERTKREYMNAIAGEVVRAAMSEAAVQERIEALAIRQPELMLSVKKLHSVLTAESGTDKPTAIYLGPGAGEARYTMTPRVSGQMLQGFDFVVTNPDTTALVLERGDFDFKGVNKVEPAKVPAADTGGDHRTEKATNVLPDLVALELAEAGYARSEQMLYEAW